MSDAIERNSLEHETPSDVSSRRWPRPLMRRLSSTPTGAFLAVLPLVFLAEALSALTLEGWLSSAGLHHAALDALADLTVIAPVLYLLFVRPTANAFREKLELEQALRASQEVLEERVAARTQRLQETNDRLRREMEDRARVQRAVDLQENLLDAVKQAVIATDAKGQIQYWSHFAEVLYGWRAEEVQGRNAREVLVFEHANGRKTDYLSVCSESRSWVGWGDALRRDGSRFPAYAVCSKLSCEVGGYVLVSLDITDLQKAEEALHQTEQKYISLVEGSPTGIFLVEDGCLTFANGTLATMLGYSVTELSGMPVSRLVHADDQERLQSLQDPSISSMPEPGACEYRFLDRAGEIRWTLLHVAKVQVRGREATLCNIQDVTEQKRMEAELRRLSNRLLVAQEEERARVARELHDSIGQTLSTIKLVVESACSHLSVPNERRADIKRLQAMVPLTQAAIEELRHITYALRPPMLDSVGLISTIHWHLSGLQKAHPGVVFEHQLSVDESDIPEALKVPMFRVLQEAMGNAIKHSGATKIGVAIERDVGDLTLRMHDNGAGFDPTSAPVPNGQGGSGLTFMRERVTGSGGRFTLLPTLELGTEIRAVWPCPERPALADVLVGRQDALLDRISR